MPKQFHQLKKLQFAVELLCKAIPLLPSEQPHCINDCRYHAVWGTWVLVSILSHAVCMLLGGRKLFTVCACMCMCVSVTVIRLMPDVILGFI